MAVAKKISQLTAVVTPAGTDTLAVVQGGTTKKLTVTQLLTLVAAGGDVNKVGTPVDNQVGVWTGDGTIEGDTGLTWDGSALQITGSLLMAQAAGPSLLDEPASGVNPTVVPNRADPDTGIGSAQVDNLSLITGGIQALRLFEGSSGVLWIPQTDGAITAFAGGGQGNLVLTSTYNRLSVVATTGDAVTLPGVFNVNTLIFIKNDGANAADIFPDTGDDLGAGVNTAVSLPAGSSISFIATVLNTTWTQWQVDTSGSGDVIKVGTPVDNQIGVWTGDGTIEGDPNLTYDAVNLEITGGEIRITGTGRPRLLDADAGPTIPTIIPDNTDTDTGIGGGSTADVFSAIAGSVQVMSWRETTGTPSTRIFGDVSSDNANGPGMINETASDVNPTLVPRQVDEDTGIGSIAVDALSVIAGGDEIARFVEVVGANQVILSPTILDNNPAAPTLAFGDGDTGFFEPADDTLRVALGGVEKWQFTGDIFLGIAGNAPRMLNEAPTATNPTLIPGHGDNATGIGSSGGGTLNLICNSVEVISFDEAGGVVNILPKGVMEGVVGTVNSPMWSFFLDDSSGLFSGGSGSGATAIACDAVEGIRWTKVGSSVVETSEANVGLTADVGSAQGNGVIESSYNVYTVVGTAGDAATLPAVFAVGAKIYVKNDDSTEAMDVFPASGDDAGAGSNIAVSVLAGDFAVFMGTVLNTTWTKIMGGTA